MKPGQSMDELVRWLRDIGREPWGEMTEEDFHEYVRPMLPERRLDSEFFRAVFDGLAEIHRSRALGFLLRMGRTEALPYLREELATATGKDRFWFARSLAGHHEDAIVELRRLYEEEVVPRDWIREVLTEAGREDIWKELENAD